MTEYYTIFIDKSYECPLLLWEHGLTFKIDGHEFEQ